MKTIVIGQFIIYSWRVSSSNEFNFLLVDRQSDYAAIFDFSNTLNSEQTKKFQSSVLSIIRSQDYSLQWWFSSHPINKKNIIAEQCSDVILAMSDKHKSITLEDDQIIDYFYIQDEILTLGSQALTILYTSNSYEIFWSDPLLLVFDLKNEYQPAAIKINNSSKIKAVLSKLPNYSEVLSNTTDSKQPFRLSDL